MQNGKVIIRSQLKPHLRVATEEDCIYLSKRLRKEDYQEIKAVSGLSPLISLLIGLEISDVPLVICNKKNKPVAMLGVVPQGLFGAIWMVGTEDLKKISLSFIKNCKGVCDVLQKDYQLLNNFVDARNTLHINWLKWMGFTFINKHQRYGVERRLFYEFVKI